jgi:hypothetical protein
MPSPNSVAVMDGSSSETVMPSPASSCRSTADRKLTAYLLDA